MTSKYNFSYRSENLRGAWPGPCLGSPEPPGRGGAPAKMGAPLFYSTTTTLKAGIIDIDQC